ncbi:solute carrier family 22 member 6-A-like [Ixodes scapularis]|uniref:solute carrier family 22 member 6-A-like n=1 Tax=Ixodes scapularis TaxID=6945 RepID=UPI001C3810F0|nr:solute carrier family 22 member 6-A-like [Ixodes scapularis]
MDGQISSCTRYEPPMLTIAENGTEVSCDRWDYNREVGASIIIELDLVCERKGLLGALQAVYIGGGAVLLPVMRSLADSYGRRLVLGLTLFGLIASRMVTSGVKTLLEFGLLQLLMSTSVTTLEAISTVMLFEDTPQDCRMLLCSINVGVPLVLGPLTLGLIGRFFVHWTAMQLVMTSPTPRLVLTIYLTDESSRWLMASWKFKEVEQVIITVANVTDLQDLNKMRFQFIKIKGEVVSRQAFGAKPNVFGIIKSTKMRARSVILFGSWFVVFYCYPSISQYRSVRRDAVTFHTTIGTANLCTLRPPTTSS